MKLGTTLSVTLAAVGAFALSAPAHAQQRAHGGGHAGMSRGAGAMNHGGGMRPGMNPAGNFRGGHYAGRGHYHGGHYYHGRYYRGSRVNFYFGGLGYPYYGYGYPYFYGYPYGYAYYPVASYTYDPQGIYEGRVVPDRSRRNSTESNGKETVSVEAQVQQQLAQGGYYHGAIDGVVGNETRHAIRSYERANGLRVDGQIDDRLLSTMGLG
jgi:putative peptidoglycan binding protein